VPDWRNLEYVQLPCAGIDGPVRHARITVIMQLPLRRLSGRNSLLPPVRTNLNLSDG
jgi:hypothetical protein